MTLLPDHLAAPVPGGYLENGRADVLSPHERDKRLLAELLAKSMENTGHVSEKTGLVFSNEILAQMALEEYSAQGLAQIETFLTEQGTFTIPVADGYTVSVDGNEQNISVVAATEIDGRPNHGDMSSMVYLRDHIQAASALMELNLQDPSRYGEEGKTGHTLLLSALHLMSTPAQLARFDDVIQRGSEAGQEDWPHISLHFNDLQGENPNGWRNKQDSFQMLAYLALDAAERGFLNAGELADGHKKFLGSIVPLLKSVGFPNYENSGSWEEVAANRTSVMAIETALLHKIKTISQNDDFGFLKEEFEKSADGDFTEIVNTMLQNGLTEVGRRLPFESPEYEKDSVKHREADAALTYVLMYDLPRLLSENRIPIGKQAEVMIEQEIENLVLSKLSTLIDSETGGMIRYKDDSYQRVNFHTDGVQETVKAIKREVQEEALLRGKEIDLDKKQALRGERTPQGQEAIWIHPVAQLSSWAASRSLQELKKGNLKEAEKYRELSTGFLNHTFSRITGENQWHATLGEEGNFEILPVPAYKLPECEVTYQPDAGLPFAVPSPHTPLNWASAATKQATGLLRTSIQRAEK